MERSRAFYEDIMGMKLLREKAFPEGKFTLAFLGYGDEVDTTVRTHAQLGTG